MLGRVRSGVAELKNFAAFMPRNAISMLLLELSLASVYVQPTDASWGWSLAWDL